MGRSEGVYTMYEEYKVTLKNAKKVLRKRQEMNAYIRGNYPDPFKRQDYNMNKSDITHWNSMISDLEQDMQMMEKYMEFNDRTFTHREYNNMKSMILNQNSHEGGIGVGEVFSEVSPCIIEDLCDIELQEEIVDLLEQVLTDRQKQVVDMYFWKGMTQEKIGIELGISQQAITKILDNALKTLKSSAKYIDLIGSGC